MSDSEHMKHRDIKALLAAVAISLAAAVLVGGVVFFWNQLEDARADTARLANQVRSLGGQPVVEGKPGARGDEGPPGPQGPQGSPGPQGPPGAPGKQGPIGITGQSPRCLLEPSKCVGPKGAAGRDGVDGADGKNGVDGKDGAPGPAGPQGEPGPAGPQGPQGEPGVAGRGISSMACQDNGQWLITYTDSTTQTVEGPCRVAALNR